MTKVLLFKICCGKAGAAFRGLTKQYWLLLVSVSHTHGSLNPRVESGYALLVNIVAYIILFLYFSVFHAFHLMSSKKDLQVSSFCFQVIYLTSVHRCWTWSRSTVSLSSIISYDRHKHVWHMAIPHSFPFTSILHLF